MAVLEDLQEMLAARGSELYGREAVTQEQHALQCAALAEADDADAPLITAALLHDIGHLLDGEYESALDEGADRRHEDIGCTWLEHWFGPAVTEPVRLHVDAKRYLCAVDPNYLGTLSPASAYTLELQGGPFTNDEAAQFISRPLARDAVQLRLWDDLAKDPNMTTPPLAHFLKTVARQIRERSDA